jgi:hypothetical protein
MFVLRSIKLVNFPTIGIVLESHIPEHLKIVTHHRVQPKENQFVGGRYRAKRFDELLLHPIMYYTNKNNKPKLLYLVIRHTVLGIERIVILSNNYSSFSFGFPFSPLGVNGFPSLSL